MAHILVIEDDEQFRNVLLRVLTQDHHQVVLANTTAEAAQCIGPNRIELIVTGTLVARGPGMKIIGDVSRAGDGAFPVIALCSGHGLMNAEFGVDAASIMGIKVFPVTNFIRADLHQVIAKALSNA